MEAETTAVPESRKMYWGGWVVSILPVLMLLVSAWMKFLQPGPVIEGFTHLGYDAGLALNLGILELACTILYVIPQTCVLGAILLTGYLGGAVATHVRVGEAFWMPVLLGVLVWGGLFLRDKRLRSLIPINRS